MENKIKWCIAISVWVFALGIIGAAFRFNIWLGIIATGLMGCWFGSAMLIEIKKDKKMREL